MNKSILGCLKDNDKKVVDIAKHFDVDPNAVYQSIRGKGSRRIRLKIALTIGRKPSALWPDNNSHTLLVDDALYHHNGGRDD